MTDLDATARAVLLAECYAPASDADAVAGGAARVAAVCAELRAAGSEVHYLGVLLVPGDELAYHVFVAAAAGAVTEVGARAGLQVERVVPAVAVDTGAARAARGRTLAVPVEVDRPVGHATGEIGA